MNPEVHPRNRHQYKQRDANSAQPRLFCVQRKRTVSADSVLRMPRGERIAGCGCAGRLDNCKIGIQNPRTRNSASDLEPLIADRSKQANEEHIIAGTLADAPENNKRDKHECNLIAAVCDCRKERIQRRDADRFKQIEQSHSHSPLFLFHPRVYLKAGEMTAARNFCAD